jgi:light-regulated signal transduction histidine kinase (bacteriophytochrome)
VVFLNILEELGKVVKISKNLPSVLGYEPTNLLGLSINEIIPFSVKSYHDESLLNFIEHYSNKGKRHSHTLDFYAYNR